MVTIKSLKKSRAYISDWPEPVLIDKENEQAGESVKEYISQVRSWKSEQGIALNAPLNTTVTYASKDLISKLKHNESIIKTTLKYPKNHDFKPGKPDVEEKITKVIPTYSKIGPTFKKDGKKLVKWINENQEEIIKTIEKKGDIVLSDIPVLDSKQKEGLIKEGYIKVERDIKVKGKKDSTIISFDDFYLELKVK